MRLRIIFSLWAMLGAQTQPSWHGTWRQENPDARYKRVLFTIEPFNEGLRVTYEMVGARGGVTRLEWIGKFDGKDYPVEGVDYVLTNAYTLIDDHHYQIAVKVDGSLAATTRVEISPDARKITAVSVQKDARGREVSTTAVYDRM